MDNTFLGFIKSLDYDRIHASVAFSHSSHFISDQYNERLERLIRRAHSSSVDPGIAEILVYELYRLDMHECYLLSGKYNIDLSANELLDILKTMDFQVFFIDNSKFVKTDIQVMITHIAMAASTLYAFMMKKPVEIFNSLYMLKDTMDPKMTERNFKEAMTFLMENIKFSQGRYVDRFLSFMLDTPLGTETGEKQKAY